MRFSCLMICLWALDAPAHAAQSAAFPGPVSAKVVSVYDGDTFRAVAEVWPGHTVAVNIRIRGIDAPEKRGRCAGERDAAHRAREALEKLLSGGAVSITNIAGAKYYGRVLADVATPDGMQVARRMLDDQLVRPYGGGRRSGWC